MVMDVERKHLKINQVWIFQLDRQSRAWAVCICAAHLGFRNHGPLHRGRGQIK